jgi:hypothetical protein
MLEFKQYTKDSEVVELYKVLEPRATEADQWDGTQTTLMNLRRAISENEAYGNGFETSTDERRDAFNKIVDLMQAEIKEARNESTGEEASEEASEDEESSEESEEDETTSPEPSDA